MQKLKRLFLLISLFLSLFLSGTSLAFNVLPKEEAFVIQINQANTDNSIQATWTIADDCYLYKKFITLNVLDSNQNLITTLKPKQWPASITKDDPEFGFVQTYFNTLSLDFDSTLLNTIEPKKLNGAMLEFKYQGCLENVLCYPPQSTIEPLLLVSSQTNPSTQQKPLTTAAKPKTNTSTNKKSTFDILSSVNANEISEWISQNSLLAQLGIFLVFGLLLAFTPCVLPMVPILAGIIVNDAKQTSDNSSSNNTHRVFSLSLSYVLGIVFVYALLGLVFGLLSQQFNLIVTLQHPIAQIVTAIIFVLLALSMFGVYELKLPQFIEQSLQQKQQSMSGGRLTSSFALGALSALVLSPCVTAPLAGALLFVSTSNNLLHGMLILATLALGMGLPLLLVTVFGSKAIPKSGMWMNLVKYFFGVLLIAVGLWVARSAIGKLAFHIGLSILFIGFGIYLFKQSKIIRAKSALALFALASIAFGGYQLFSAYQAEHLEQKGYYDVGVDSLVDLQVQIQNSTKPVIVDFYADWCISCQHLINNVFVKPEAQTALEPFHFIKIDLSNVKGKALNEVLNTYTIIGLPAILFFDNNKQEISQARITGEISLEAFLEHIQKTTQ